MALDTTQFVHWFRGSSPYINAHRGKTFVILFGGEALDDGQFANMAHDFALLNTLGIRVVLVHGARPQIERRLAAAGTELHYVNGLRVTGDAALPCVKEAVGAVRMDIEALLSMGLTNTPGAGRVRAASGNFVTARPLGIRDGVDYLHTGELRKLDTAAVNRHLDEGAMVLLSPVGYSPTGEIFNLSAEEVATAAAIQLRADKFLCFTEAQGLLGPDGALIHQLTVSEAAQALEEGQVAADMEQHVRSAVHACRYGVRRAHLVGRHIDGGLLLELFTRNGVGTLITADGYDTIRQARIDDIGGILELIAPLEQEGVLVRRSREHLEMEIEHFTVAERDGMVVGCAALYGFADEGVGELACLAVSREYRQQGRGDQLLAAMEARALEAGIDKLFVLTTRTAHWFQERGFREAALNELPVKRQALYNYQRRSKVFIKQLERGSRIGA